MAAMKPDSRPISLTMPMPLKTLAASMWAQRMASAALSTAVSKPKEWGMKLMSLSMVFGIPTMEMCLPRRATSCWMDAAAFIVPSPPMMNSALMFRRSRAVAISDEDCGPLDVPRIVPPNSWMPSTLCGVSSRTSY